MSRGGARHRASCPRAPGWGATALTSEASDESFMRAALALSVQARRRSSPNPWVGCIIVDETGQLLGGGATEAVGGRHAEAVALDQARGRARGATVFVTLEPCSRQGRTPPCAERLIRQGVARVVIGALDPDPEVCGTGLMALKQAGVETALCPLDGAVESYLAPYMTHRRSGRPFVILKLAATIDGRIAAPDGSSRWITGPEAREDVHRLRADSDAVLVGAGTVRADDPELTVRLQGEAHPRQPLRVVLGRVAADARVRPAIEVSGDPRGVLDMLGQRGVLQLLVEGGATVAGELHRLGLVDRYVIYLGPVILGGDDGRPMLAGRGANTMPDAWRGQIVGIEQLGGDLRLDLAPSGVASQEPSGTCAVAIWHSTDEQ
ncbi:MAG: bifunctional diaminohydroxyphosphoribosylaminopyrimidine deaminase/5-amino-6-(5-phosphoribosylamino)uracil reductase RibD [Acidimicrobiales bacterium]